MAKFPVCESATAIRHVLIGFQGWNSPGDKNAGKKLGPADPSTLAKLFRTVEQEYSRKKAACDPGLAAAAYATDTFDNVKTSAVAFIKKHIPNPAAGGNGAKILVYGFSWGGDTAVELCADLKKSRHDVDLLITVDAALGPFSQGAARDTVVPSNVARNVNYLTKTPSSRIGSQGVKHSAADPKKTVVVNKVYSGVSHGGMDEHVFDETKSLLLNALTSQD